MGWLSPSGKGRLLRLDKIRRKVEHDVVLVKDGVGELLLELFFIEEALNALGHHRLLQNLVDVGTPLYVNCQHLRD